MKLDAVIKLGGSLIKDGVIDKNIKELTEIQEDYTILIVVGGGELADGVRSFSSRYDVSAATAHWAAIRCMDLNAKMVDDLIEDTEFAESVEQAEKAFLNEKIPLMKTEEFMKSQNHPQSWKVTSDSISGLIAKKLGADRLIIATDVDGIYSGDKLITDITPEELQEHGKTCIDEFLPKILEENNMSCTVVSGKKPKRLEKAVIGKKVNGTHIG